MQRSPFLSRPMRWAIRRAPDPLDWLLLGIHIALNQHRYRRWIGTEQRAFDDLLEKLAEALESGNSAHG